MKKQFFYLIAVLCSTCIFTSCSDDDDPYVPPTKVEMYTASNGLKYTYGGTDRTDITVLYTPDATDPQKATLTLSSLGSKRSENISSAPLLSPGNIVPGTNELVIPVTLIQNAYEAIFSGNGETPFCTYRYNGSVNDLGLTIAIDQVTMKGAPIIEAKTYTDKSGLQLMYNDAPMLGKVITFTPNLENLEEATLTMQGAPLDISAIIEGMVPAADASTEVGLPTTGVFPGNVTFTLPIKISADNTFSGKSETEHCTFSYSGKITESTLKLAISDVKLKNAALAGLTLNVPYANEDFTLDPLHFVWESDTKVELFPGFGMPVSSIVGIALRMPTIPTDQVDEEGNPVSVSVTDMLPTALKSITFGIDGNISAVYVDIENGATEPTTSPLNIAQYIVNDDDSIHVFLNPAAIIYHSMANAPENRSRAVDMGEMVAQLMGIAMPLLTDGVPVQMSQNAEDNSMDIYLGTEFLVPILKCASPLFEDEDFINMLLEEMAKDPTFGSMAPMMGGALRTMPKIIDTTTKIELGIHFLKAE